MIEPGTDVVVIPPAPVTEPAPVLSFDPFQFRPGQVAFLLAAAQYPDLTTVEVCKYLVRIEAPRAPTHRTVWYWQQHEPAFKEALDLIRKRPPEAANFLVAHSEIPAVATLRSNLRQSGTVSNDAAKALLAESRARRGERMAQGLWGAIESALR